MKLDNDLFRTILIVMEDDPASKLGASAIEIKPGVQSAGHDKFIYHLHMLIEAELVTKSVPKSMNLRGKEVPLPSSYSVSLKGHEFLANIKNETVWNQTKEAALKSGGTASLAILGKLAEGFTTALIRSAGGPI